MNAEINVTSLIDVAFTLLVIFIITAPMLQGGLEVRLPEARVPPVTAQDDPFIVSVDERGTVYIGETPFTMEEFEASFTQLVQAASPGAIYVKGDADARYGPVARVQARVFEVSRELGISWVTIYEQEWRR